MKSNKMDLILSIIAAIIMLQTLFYKFSANPESTYIFSTLGIEPWGRIAAGISELIASLLLIFNRTRLMGALMAIGIMLGAIAAHLFVLGIVVKEDGGLLFTLALITFMSCAILAFRNRDKIPQLLRLKF